MLQTNPTWPSVALRPRPATTTLPTEHKDIHHKCHQPGINILHKLGTSPNLVSLFHNILEVWTNSVFSDQTAPVCHSVSIFWTHKYNIMVKTTLLNFYDNYNHFQVSEFFGFFWSIILYFQHFKAVSTWPSN